jgi:hypothetical protein
MNKLMKKLLLGGAILVVVTFAICYKVRANFNNIIKAEIQAVKAQNEDLKAELCQIKDLLERQAKDPFYSWTASNTAKTNK